MDFLPGQGNHEKTHPKAGFLKNTFKMADDFDAPLDDFKRLYVMNLLLDTHALIWFCEDDEKLSVEAKKEIENPGNTLFISIASLWRLKSA